MMLNTDFEIFFDLQMVPHYNFLGLRSLLRASREALFDPFEWHPENLETLPSKEATRPLAKEMIENYC